MFSVSVLNNKILTVEVKHWTLHLPMSFQNEDAITLLIGPILLARTWNGKSNCPTNQKKGGERESAKAKGDANKHQKWAMAPN